MDFKRFPRLFATLWWLVLLIAVSVGAFAFYVTRWHNSGIEETWEATSPVLILQTSDESDEDYESRLRLTESRARLAVESLLADEAPGYRVTANPELGRLDFSARGPSAVFAETLAEGLRATYLAAEPTDGIIEQLERNLDDLEVEILALQNTRDAVVVVAPIDPDVASELSLIESQLATLRQQAALLSVASRFPELGIAVDEEGIPLDPETVQAELAATQDLLARVQAAYEALRTSNPVQEAVDEDTSLELLVIDQKLRDLESQYIETALTIDELKGDGSSSVLSNQTETVNVTAAAASPTRNGLFGLVLGALLAIALILITDRMRRPLLGIETDLDLPTVARVDLTRYGSGGDEPWYPDSSGRRRGDVQAVRSALDQLDATGTVTIGFAGLGASASAVQELAGDVATSVAVSGREVFLVDAVFDAPSDVPEYGDSGASLAELIMSDDAPRRTRDELKVAIGDRDHVVPDMLSLRAGELSMDAVDALAGRVFKEVLGVVSDFAEVVIVAAPHWGFPEADVLAQRLDYFVLVSRVGVATASDVERAAAELAARSASPLGLVVLDGKFIGMVALGAPGPLGFRLPAWRSRKRRSERSLATQDALTEELTEQSLAQESDAFGPLDATGPAAVVGQASESREDVPPTDALLPDEGEIGHPRDVDLETPDAAGPQLRDGGSIMAEDAASADPAGMSARPEEGETIPGDAAHDEPASKGESFLVERVGYLLSHGIDREKLQGHPAGALLMFPGSSSDGAATALYEEVAPRVAGGALGLGPSLREVLGVERDVGRSDLIAALDQWIHRRLVVAQAEQGVEPVAYHLSSQLGAFQALVDASSFDPGRAEALLETSVRRIIDELEQRALLEGLRVQMGRQAKRKRERVANLRNLIGDVKRFAAALEDLSATRSSAAFTRDQLVSAGVLDPMHWIES
jgi:hypothetical protein